MRVNPHGETAGPIRPTPLRSKGAPEEPRDAVDFTGPVALARVRENVPTMRADKVAKAKALVAGPAYPNETTLRRVAGVLADHIEQPERPE